MTLIAIAVVAVGAVALRPHVKPLLPESRRLFSVDSAHPWYWWITDDELITFGNPAKGDLTIVRRNVKSIQSGTSDLSAPFLASRGKPESIQVAPLGDYVLWEGADGDIRVADIDGAKIQTVKPKGPGERRWLYDGRWMEILRTDELYSQVLIHEAGNPGAARMRPLTPAVPANPREFNAPAMIATPDDHVVSHYWNGAEGRLDPLRIVAMGFVAAPSIMGKLSFPAPKQGAVGEAMFSPISTRIAWKLNYKPSDIFGARYTGIWVMKMDGGELQEVGSVEDSTGDALSAVKWMPDGGSLSFVYQGYLYTVPIE